MLIHLLLFVLPFAVPTPFPQGCNGPHHQHEDKKPGSYIVKLRDGYTLEQHFDTIGQKLNVTKLRTGYHAGLSTDELVKVRKDCGVHFVEDNAYIRLDVVEDDDPPSVVPRATQDNARWPLYQLSASEKTPTDQTYYYLDGAGKGVDLYILDTGINHPQDEFTDDAGNDRVFDFFNLSEDPDYNDSRDRGGHGHPIASAAAGKMYGVAKSAHIINAKFMGGDEATEIANFVESVQKIIDRHNSRKSDDAFKGSVINMSYAFPKGQSGSIEDILNKANTEGIALVASAGNGGYDPEHFPSGNPNVISAAASDIDYAPLEQSNYGEGVITLWAPGKSVPLRSKDGSEVIKTGTSFAAGFTTGILAIFYGVEGRKLDPSLVKTRLTAQADDWIDLPAGKDWHNSPTLFANTGNRKGAAQDPPVVYIGGPNFAVGSATTTAPTATPTSSIHPTQGRQSPGHKSPLTSFTLDQGNSALSTFNEQCQGVELKPNGPVGCTLYFNPCFEEDGKKAVNLKMTLWQSVWEPGTTSTWPDVAEIQEAGEAIMNNCDTTTTTKKWGGYKSVSVASGMRMYNISANHLNDYPTLPGFHTTQITKTSGDENCDAWDSST